MLSQEGGAHFSLLSSFLSSGGGGPTSNTSRRASRSLIDAVTRTIHRWVIPFEEITLKRLIGYGSFGEVWKGKWRGSTVAVKKFFRQQANESLLLELRKESVIMSELRHPNILLFLGACVEPPNLCIVTEYMKYGSIGKYLRNKDNPLTWLQRLQMAKSTAIGMDYLHSFKPPIIHRDLSSYNILIDEHLHVKIADFGLARIKQSNITMTRCGTPAWTAPEILKRMHYSEKGDVYSFGIILWEFLTRCKPYKGLEPVKLCERVVKGLRPKIPEDCPADYRLLVTQCWDTNPDGRPSFESIPARIESMEQELKSGNSSPAASPRQAEQAAADASTNKLQSP